MVFSSNIFIGIFLPVFLIVYFINPNRQWRNIVFLIFSLVFYSWGEPLWVFGMMALTLIDYLLARFVGKVESSAGRKWFIFLTVTLNLAALFTFKYYNFFADTIDRIFGTHLPDLTVSMPIGISFFTFQALTYVVDVYRGEVEPQKNYFKVLLYISMFPQLIAGPIVRYADVAYQIDNRHETTEGFQQGMFRFSIGLAKKVIFANYAGTICTSLLSSDHLPNLTTGGAWFGILMWMCQVYFDFAGYSDMAIGLGLCTGFKFKENFIYPYMATSVTDLWRRWHISLGSFFRDYVYIPCGGNRKHQYLNIAIVWALTGLWHGASWNFVLWGLFFGAVLVLEKWLRKLDYRIERIPILNHVLSIFIVMIGWPIFYFPDPKDLKLCYLAMIGYHTETAMTLREATPFYQYFFIVIAMFLCCTPIFSVIANAIFPKEKIRTDVAKGIFASCVIAGCFFILLMQSYNPFLYFRF